MSNEIDLAGTDSVSPGTVSLAGRHQSVQQVARYFAWIDPPDRARLDKIRRDCGALAALMVCELPDGPELTAGLRKLLEAKDCFVRAAL